MKPVKKKIELSSKGWGRHGGVDYEQGVMTAGCLSCGQQWGQTVSADGTIVAWTHNCPNQPPKTLLEERKLK